MGTSALYINLKTSSKLEEDDKIRVVLFLMAIARAKDEVHTETSHWNHNQPMYPGAAPPARELLQDTAGRTINKLASDIGLTQLLEGASKQLKALPLWDPDFFS